MGAPHLSVRTRLLDNCKIDEVTGCWLWTGSTDSSGRGQIKINGKLEMVSRVSYEEFVGPLKNWALHKRECPNPICFNPKHLYDGTSSENRIDDIVVNNRNGFGAALQRRQLTHCKRGHEFTPENTKSYKGGRDCIACSRIRALKSYNKRKELLNRTITL